MLENMVSLIESIKLKWSGRNVALFYCNFLGYFTISGLKDEVFYEKIVVKISCCWGFCYIGICVKLLI